MRFRLRTLLIVAAIAPMLIGGSIAVRSWVHRMIRDDYKRMVDEVEQQKWAKALPAKQAGGTNVPLSTL